MKQPKASQTETIASTPEAARVSDLRAPGKAGAVADVQAGVERLDWFVVKTNPKSERLVVEGLERRQFPAYAPMRLKIGRAGRVSEIEVEPLFPTYVFVGLSSASPSWIPVLSLRGVRRPIMRGDRPAMISEKALHGIRAVERQSFAQLGRDVVSTCPFEPGEALEVLFGGIAVEAIFSKRVDAQRIAVLLKVLLGRDSHAVVPLASVTTSKGQPI